MVEEHEAGVNQVIRLNQNELATASHDFTIRIWDTSVSINVFNCISSLPPPQNIAELKLYKLKHETECARQALEENI